MKKTVGIILVLVVMMTAVACAEMSGGLKTELAAPTIKVNEKTSQLIIEEKTAAADLGFVLSGVLSREAVLTDEVKTLVEEISPKILHDFRLPEDFKIPEGTDKPRNILTNLKPGIDVTNFIKQDLIP